MITLETKKFFPFFFSFLSRFACSAITQICTGRLRHQHCNSTNEHTVAATPAFTFCHVASRPHSSIYFFNLSGRKKEWEEKKTRVLMMARHQKDVPIFEEAPPTRCKCLSCTREVPAEMNTLLLNPLLPPLPALHCVLGS